MNAFLKTKDSLSDIRILQISDSHLFASTNEQLVGINTDESFLAIVELAKQHSWPPDFIFLTGDLSQDSSNDAYQRLISHLKPLGVSCYVLPGNHDDPEMLRNIFSKPDFLYQPFLHTENWLFAFLNTAIPNEEGGILYEQEIIELEQQINAHPEKNILVCLHHQLQPVNSRWLDTMAVRNPGLLIDLLARYPNIQGIIHGHVHQEFTSNINGTPIYSTPSTCFQFKPNSNDFAIDDTAPGYRWLELGKQGNIRTSIVRLKKTPDSLDRYSNGY
ncbi:MAG: 3',5'-cyclic-AMP phosphodiesterase [Piscirickettsiaceae bacterium]|nr:MAG: 3',5'-cyclic-AMP phosphodiesterase [Piscirickettsiaceae bacterium]